MSSYEPRRTPAAGRRLQAVLVLLILWDAVNIVTELSFGGALFKASDDQIGGWLGARGSFGGAALMPIGVYFYTLVRGPLRHRNLLWVAVLEHGAAALFATYHVAAGHVLLEATIVPLAVSAGLLVLVLLSMPRSQAVA